MKSQNVKRVVKGNLGYIFTRDNSEDSLLTQLKNVVKVPILFRNTVEVEEIRLDYDYVVVATGNPDVPKKMNTFASTFRSYARVARIGGQFKTDSVSLWLNTEYAKTGFAYLVPCTDNDARLALVVNNILGGEIDKYWGKFLDAEKLTNNVGSFTDIKHELGIITPVQLGNVLFVGNAGGFIDSVVGFGSLNALLSGLLAAKSIIDNHDFNEVSRDMRKDIREKDEFRKAIDTYTNANFDNLVSAVAFPGIKQLIYRNPVFRITNTTFLAKAYNRKVRK